MSYPVTVRQLREAVPDHVVKEWIEDVISELKWADEEKEWPVWSEKDRAALEASFWSVLYNTLEHIAPLLLDQDPDKAASTTPP